MDAGDSVTDFHRLDQGPQVSLAERDFSLGDLLAHEEPKTGDLFCIQSGCWSLAFDPLKGG